MINNKMIESQASKIKGYYRIKNNHIFVQSLNGDEYMLDFINSICKIENQRIHIFELNPLSIKGLIEMIINNVDYKTKVIIYIPKKLKDYAKVLENLYSNINKNWKITIYKESVKFIDNYNHINRLLEVKFRWESVKYRLDVSYLVKFKDVWMSKYEYDNPENNVIRTTPQSKYPELFKNKIIRNFKRCCSKNILTSFKNDEDIWEFILDEDNKKESE